MVYIYKKYTKKINSFLQDDPTIIEIGYGDGSFLYGLSRLLPNARLVGFDPHGARRAPDCMTLRNELFIPEEHIAEIRPNLIVSRHVLEHLVNPVGFLERISYCVSQLSLNVLAYFEVPCVDNMVATNRTVDLYYEHSSQFTVKSFSTMLSRCGAKVLQMDRDYNGEVVYAVIQMGDDDLRRMASEAVIFNENTLMSLGCIQKQIEALIQSGKSIAIWGGTGKSAAFMNRYNCDAERFPLVVDSDPEKVGTFVPGTGQQIRLYDYLKDHPVQVIIIPPQWRAKDILQEMKLADICPESILVEHDCRLVDYAEYAHLSDRS